MFENFLHCVKNVHPPPTALEDRSIHYGAVRALINLRSKVPPILEGLLDQRRQSPAEDDLFTKEVGFRFFAKIRLKNPGTPSADR